MVTFKLDRLWGAVGYTNSIKMLILHKKTDFNTSFNILSQALLLENLVRFLKQDNTCTLLYTAFITKGSELLQAFLTPQPFRINEINDCMTRHLKY